MPIFTQSGKSSAAQHWLAAAALRAATTRRWRALARNSSCSKTQGFDARSARLKPTVGRLIRTHIPQIEGKPVTERSLSVRPERSCF